MLKGKLEHQNQNECAEQKISDQLDILARMRTELQRLTTENMQLKAKIAETKFTQESLQGKDEKVKYYTGLPGYSTLVQVFNLIEPYLTDSVKSSLTKFEKLLMVLMKLRLNLSIQDLAYRFDISKPTVSRTFNHVIHVMYERMKSFIFWPDREQLQLTMPMEFRKSFGLKVAIIIDCFEIFIERPSNLLARAET